MKYNLNEKIKPFESKLWLVMKDNNTYPSDKYPSSWLDLNILFEQHQLDIENGFLYGLRYIGKAYDQLISYIEKEYNKPLSADDEITRFIDLQTYVERFAEEILFKQFKEMFASIWAPFFDFTEHGTIYSKEEFKKAYVNSTIIELPKTDSK